MHVGCNYHTNYHLHQIDCINQKVEFKKKKNPSEQFIPRTIKFQVRRNMTNC